MTEKYILYITNLLLLSEEGIPAKVGAHGSSISINLPKDIVERFGLIKGSSITFKIEGDIITLRKTDSSLPLDLLTRDVLDLMAGVRNLKAKRLEIEENYLRDLDQKGRIEKLRGLLITEKGLHTQFEALKKQIHDTFDSIGESFHAPELKGLEDVFKLGRHINANVGSDYDSFLDFMQELKRGRDKYFKLAEKTQQLAQDKKITANDAIEISQQFLKEAKRYKDMLKKIADTSASL